MKKRKYLSGKKREEIWLKFNKRCAICKRETVLFRPRGWGYKPVANIDHIIPFSKGGKCEDSNYRLLCHTCNCSIQDTMNDSSARGLYV